jgi:hypothetical protein
MAADWCAVAYVHDGVPGLNSEVRGADVPASGQVFHREVAQACDGLHTPQRVLRRYPIRGIGG